MSSAHPKPNMRQVAALAGVSHQTVSRVLNDHPSIRAETRERVLAVIEEVNYRPNSAARALATKRSNRIGVLLDSAVEYGPNSTLRAIEHAGRAAGYAVSSVTVDEGSVNDPRVALEHLISQGIDALCIIAPRSSSLEVLRDVRTGIPTLVVKAAPDDAFLTTSVDQEFGAALAVDHLVALGHERIAHISGPLDWLDAQGRERGWRDAIQRAGLPESETMTGDWTSDTGYALAMDEEWAAGCTAVFAANDQMALGLIHGLHHRGISVPGDISVVGFDDLPDARHFIPPLTTIRQDFRALGERSLDVLAAAIEGRPIERRAIIRPTLVERSSTAPRR